MKRDMINYRRWDIQIQLEYNDFNQTTMDLQHLEIL